MFIDSAHSIALKGVIQDQELVSNSSSHAVIKSIIQDQFRYSVGQLNGYEGVADLNRIEIEILEVRAQSGGKFLARYSAKLIIAWPKDASQPASIDLILPSGIDYRSLLEFFYTYNKPECRALESHDVVFGNFWYYYRPNNSDCSLDTDPNPEYANRVPMTLSLSDENTTGKFPEYEKVWEDKRLIATAIFGKFDAKNSTNSDAGVRAYRFMYQSLLNFFGNPVSNSVGPDDIVGVDTPEISLEFNSELGIVEVHLLLVAQISSPSAEFVTTYNRLTRKSDFIAYSGHSGLGGNIRALARMGQFEPNQYQIFLINGCDTFAYVDHSLRDAHAAANPQFGPYKCFAATHLRHQ